MRDVLTFYCWEFAVRLSVDCLRYIFGFGSFVEGNGLAGVPEIMPDACPLRDCGF
jgi:hypothetical protein